MSRFVMGSEVPTENFDWGSAGMRSAPPVTGCESFVVMDVRLDPGFFHAFHKHPDQDEMITVVEDPQRLSPLAGFLVMTGWVGTFLGGAAIALKRRDA